MLNSNGLDHTHLSASASVLAELGFCDCILQSYDTTTHWVSWTAVWVQQRSSTSLTSCLFQAGLLSVPQVLLISVRIKELLSQLRPNAVALVDAFNVHDKKLNSVLGRYDGNVYEHLFEWARRSPLNSTEVSKSHNLVNKRSWLLRQ